jgi:two-component system, NarL family, nitrate/nitrite response regulator NarL
LPPNNVLVVDDDPSIRMLIRIALSVEDGFGEVREAESGRAALTVCETFAPDVVVLDYLFPDGDAYVTAAAIRRMHPEARIVVFSAVLETKPDWADGFLGKGRVRGIADLIHLARTA